ncbi:hypothetical protein U472_03255 [Orenia metallireducens]|uniref:Uncharacterized protein n=1 Tax=Orenia metallireducens TaxID=1413210 RepID=A0A1C0AB28_9FIRM|nr:hypothetical protein [Orenia metallireducens]OCL27585.1 hypothetical protein U472_03255 [Orenia metallireducens]
MLVDVTDKLINNHNGYETYKDMDLKKHMDILIKGSKKRKNQNVTKDQMSELFLKLLKEEKGEC